MKNLNLLKVLTLAVLFVSSISFASSNTDSVSELSLRYRMMSNDYATSSELVDSVFSNFQQTQSFWSQSLEQLAHNREFLTQLQKFSVAMNQLVGEQPTDDQKKNSLETLITILSESAGANEKITGQSLPKVYQDYLRSMMKSGNSAPVTTAEQSIKVKGNEVLRTVGTYGIWGFWFVTSTWGLVAMSPNMENFLYYPAFAMFIASGPFSISNQIWAQVFDRLEKKATLQHKSALQYMKDKIRSLKNFRRAKTNQCLAFYG
ncbi:MAG: hypothetical protein JNM24_05155 [Bdellovibrionaceae bacterium]|nr:hypothetical protein [Pseudobdellovibrionaceae bacterium]